MYIYDLLKTNINDDLANVIQKYALKLEVEEYIKLYDEINVLLNGKQKEDK